VSELITVVIPAERCDSEVATNSSSLDATIVLPTSQDRAEHIILSPNVQPLSTYLKEVWRYREVIANFIHRDLTTRYRNTCIGLGWAVAQPSFTMIVVSICLGKTLAPRDCSVPYPLLLFCGLLPWQYFSSAVSRCSNSVLQAGGLMKKVYFPRVACPIASLVAPLVDFGAALVFACALMWFYHTPPQPNILFLPLFLLLAMANAFGIGLWISALNVRFRDMSLLLPFILQLLMFASPIFYTSSTLPDQVKIVSFVNPLCAVVDGFRWSLLSVGEFPGLSTLSSILIALLLIVTGGMYFRAREDQFADFV